MSFAKAAAEAVYASPADEEKEAERSERNREILQLAIASGLLLGGAGLAYANRERLADMMSGRLFDSRTPTSKAVEEATGMSPASVGGSVGLLSSFGPLRKSRALLGDMASQNDLPGVAKRIHSKDPRFARLTNTVGAGNADAAAGIARAISAATADGGERSLVGRLAQGPAALDAPDFDTATGQRLVDPNATVGSRLRSLFGRDHGRRQMEAVTAGLEAVDREAGVGRQAVAAGTPLDQLPVRQRNAIRAEEQVLAAAGVKPPRPGQRAPATPPLTASMVAHGLREGRNTPPPWSVGRALGRTAIGAGLGELLSGVTDYVRGVKR
jgi:hypothetical protein